MPIAKWAIRSVQGIDYKELPRDVKTGDLLFNDGLLVFEVLRVNRNEVHCIVRQRWRAVKQIWRINRQGGGLTAPPLTAKRYGRYQDRRACSRLISLAVSFPKSGADMYMARELMRAAGGASLPDRQIERSESRDARSPWPTSRGPRRHHGGAR